MEPLLDRIVETALELPQPRRERYLRRVMERWPVVGRRASSEVAELSALGCFLEPERPSTTSFELGSGMCVGGFRIDRLHARGPWGDVYLAVDPQDRLVALKVGYAGISQDALAAIVGVPLSHVVEVHAVGTDASAGVDFVAMRFVQGASLQQALSGLKAAAAPSSVAVRRIVALCAEVADGLAALHARGLVHRDVKPANILVEGVADPLAEGGSAVLVDLGVLRLSGAGSALSTVYATLPYAAPEQVLGLSVDGRADVFALGVTLHDLLAARSPEQRGRRPAAGMEPLDEVARWIDAALAAIVAEATEPDPRRRYPSAAALAADLRAWMAGAPPAVRPVRWLPRVCRALQREPRRSLMRIGKLLLASMGLGLLALGGWRVWRDSVGIAELGHLLHRGDLPAAVAAEAELSETATWLRSSPLALVDDPATSEVLRLLRRGADDAARRRAARALACDGLEAHPPLARWFLVALDRPAWEERAPAVRLLAKLMLDRPARALPESPLESELRESCAALAARSTDVEERMDLAVALGGFLGPRAISALQTLIERAVASSSDVKGCECVRVATCNLERVVGRSCVDPICGEETRRALPDILGRVVAAVASLRDSTDATVRPPSAVVERLFALVAGECQRRGWDLPDPTIVRGAREPTPFVLAAVRDPRFFLWLDDLRRGEADDDALTQDGYGVGYMLGTAGEDVDASPWTRLVVARVVPSGVDPAPFLAGLRIGCVSGQKTTEPQSDRWAPDAGSRLQDLDSAGAAGFTALPTGAARLVKDELATWQFDTGCVAEAGVAISARGRAVHLGADELQPAKTYLWLGAPGESAVRLRFRAPVLHQPLLSLHLALQKAQRSVLPYAGSAGLSVAIDGRPVATIADLRVASPQTIVLPLARNQPGIDRVVEVRLSTDSSTTVRVYRVTVE